MNAAQYVEQLRSLLPPGRALDDAGQGMLTQLLSGMSQEMARVDASAWALIDESLPDSAVQLLPDWERVCALPDDCTPSGQTISQRQQAVVARIIGNGTPSIPYLTDLATQLGYTVTIVRRRAFQCGMSCGAPLGGFDWNFAWEVQAPLYSVTRFLAGQGRAGDPLASWQNNVLECVMRQHAPAHTTPIFQYWQTFTDTQFAVADGTTQDLQLTDGQGNAVTTNVNVSAIYCNDWQGLQLLTPAPRTNFVQENDNLAAWAKYVTGAGAASVVQMTDPVVGTFWRITKTAGASGDRGGIRIGLSGLSGSGYTTDCYVRASSATVTFTAPYVDAVKVGGGDSTQGGILSGAQYAGSSFVRSVLSPPTNDALAGTAWLYLWVQSAIGDYIDVKFPGLWLGWRLTAADIGAAFATGASATTLTDYTLKNAGQVHLGQLPTVGAVFTWDGNTKPSY